MAKLKPCSNCGENVSQWAATCPHCQKSNPAASRKDKIFGGVILMAAAIFALSMCNFGQDGMRGSARDILDAERVGNVSASEWLALDHRIRINTAAHYYLFNSTDFDSSDALLSNNSSKLYTKAGELEQCASTVLRKNLDADYYGSGKAFIKCFSAMN